MAGQRYRSASGAASVSIDHGEDGRRRLRTEKLMNPMERISEAYAALGRRIGAALDYLVVRYLMRLPRHAFDAAAQALAGVTAETFKWAEFRPYVKAILTATYNDLFLDEKARVLLGAMDKASPAELERALDSVDYRGARAKGDDNLKAARYCFTEAVLHIFAAAYRASPLQAAAPGKREPVVQ